MNEWIKRIEKLEAEKKALLEFVRWAAEGYGYIFTESMCNKAKDVLIKVEGK